MSRTVKILLAVVLSILAAASAALAAGFVPTEPIMPLSEVKPGMLAEARTVMSGKAITPFRVRIVGVLPRKTSPKALILIKIEDQKVVANGGVAAGMSGSPVYIGGKLVGAIGYSWSFSDRSLGLVTPIEEMMKVFNWPDKIPQFAAPPALRAQPVSEDAASTGEAASEDESAAGVSFDVITSQDENEKPEESGDIKEKSGDAVLSVDLAALAAAELKPLSMPLLVDGLGPRAAEGLGKRLGRELIPLGSSSLSSSVVDLRKTLKPGSAMGVSLVWGDIALGGIGTLTAVDSDGRFLAFGHPMESLGAVAMPLTDASIIRIIPSQLHSFKLGYMGPMIGLVTQDRPEAIGGRFGKLAPADSYTVRFNDIDADRKVVKRFQTISDSFVGPQFGSQAMLAVIDDLWARSGEGTAMLKYRFTGGGFAKGWERRNIFFDEKDLVKSMFKEFDALAKIFSINQFQDVRPLGVDLSVEMTRDPRVVYIEKLVIVNRKKVYSPGDKVELSVTLRPWHKRPVVKRIKLRVPPKAMGLCEIDVRGGGIEEPEEDALVNGLRSLTNFDDLLKELSVMETNNQIVAEIGGPEMPDELSDLLSAVSIDEEEDIDAETLEKVLKATKKDKDEELPKALTDDRLRSELREEAIRNNGLVIIDTNYYVEGLLRKFIKVRSPKGLGDISEADAEALMKNAGKPKKHKTPEEEPVRPPESDADFRFGNYER